MKLRLIVRRLPGSQWFYWIAITGDSRCRVIGRKDELYPEVGMLSVAEAIAKAFRQPWLRVMPDPEWVAEVEAWT